MVVARMLWVCYNFNGYPYDRYVIAKEENII